MTAACGRLPYRPFSSAAIVMALGVAAQGLARAVHVSLAQSVKLQGPFMMKVAEHPCRLLLFTPLHNNSGFRIYRNHRKVQLQG